MSLYELFSTVAALNRRSKKIVPVTDEEHAEFTALMSEIAMRDPSVRI